MATLTLVLGLAVFAYASGESKLLQPGRKTVKGKPGEKVVLDCVVADVGGEDKVLWTKGDGQEAVAINGMQLMFDPNINVRTVDTNDGTNHQLTINKFSGQYADIYYCILDRGDPDWDSKQKAVFTVGAAEPESSGESKLLQPGRKTVKGKPGEKVVLDCVVADVGGEDKVLWTKGDGQEAVAINGMQLMFDPNINVRTVDTNDGTNHQLTINKFSGQYADIYYCVLDRGEADWDSKQKAAFTVQGDEPELPPKVSTPRFLSFEEGTKAELKCTVKNYKGKSIMWLKRPKIDAVSSELLSIGKTIYFEPKSKYQVKVENVDDSTHVVTLMMSSIKRNDAGKFACSVQVLGMKFDDYPSSEVTVTVKEKGIPKPKQCYWKAFENSRLPHVTKEQYTKLVGPKSALECMARCRKQPGCKSMSYSSRAFTCYLMKVSSGGDVTKIGPLEDYLYAELFC